MQFFKKQTSPQTPEEIALQKEYEQKANLAYQKAKGEQRILNAEKAGQQDANQLANNKPFYQKVTGLVMAVGKDMIQNAPNVNPDALFNMNTEREPKRHRRKQRKKKRN